MDTTREHPVEQDSEQSALPRRRLLRSLAGAAVGLAVLVGAVGCGGGDDDDDDDDDDD